MSTFVFTPPPAAPATTTTTQDPAIDRADVHARVQAAISSLTEPGQEAVVVVALRGSKEAMLLAKLHDELEARWPRTPLLPEPGQPQPREVSALEPIATWGERLAVAPLVPWGEVKGGALAHVVGCGIVIIWPATVTADGHEEVRWGRHGARWTKHDAAGAAARVVATGLTREQCDALAQAEPVAPAPPKPGDHVAWNDVPSGALVRDNVGEIALRIGERGDWVYLRVPFACGAQWVWYSWRDEVAWSWPADDVDAVTIVALDVPQGATPAEMRALVEKT